jgi:HSP20 family protein
MSYLGTTNNKTFQKFSTDIDHFFEENRFLAHSPFSKSWLAKDKAASNLSKSEKGYELQIALLGFDKEAVRISIENSVLMVSAIKSEYEDKEKDFIVKEFHQENIYRTFTLNDQIDEENITAKLSNGILHILLPTKAPHEPTISRTVEIQ